MKPNNNGRGEPEAAPDLLEDLPQGKTLLTVPQLAKRLGVAEKTIRRWKDIGCSNVRLRARSINGCRFGFAPEGVKAFFRLLDKRRGFTK